MPIINEDGYIVPARGSSNCNKVEWLPKYRSAGHGDRVRICVSMGIIYFPERYGGKRVRLKVEVVDDNGGTRGLKRSPKGKK